MIFVICVCKETSDLANKIKYGRLDKLYATQAANTWEDVGLNFTVPSGHVYLARVGCNWMIGKPIGLAISEDGSAIYRNYPNDGMSVMTTSDYLLIAGSYGVMAMREAASSTQNSYYVYYLDITL